MTGFGPGSRSPRWRAPRAPRRWAGRSGSRPGV